MHFHQKNTLKLYASLSRSLLFEIMCSLIVGIIRTLRVEHNVAYINPTYNLPIVSLLSPKVSISTLWLFLLMYPVKFKHSASTFG